MTALSFDPTQTIGRRIKIFIGTNESYWGSADVVDYLNDKLILKNIETFNHKKKDNVEIMAAVINRVEFTNPQA